MGEEIEGAEILENVRFLCEKEVMYTRRDRDKQTYR